MTPPTCATCITGLFRAQSDYSPRLCWLLQIGVPEPGTPHSMKASWEEVIVALQKFHVLHRIESFFKNAAELRSEVRHHAVS